MIIKLPVTLEGLMQKLSSEYDFKQQYLQIDKALRYIFRIINSFL